MSLCATHPANNGGHPEAGFIEPYAARKVRLAASIKTAARVARESRESAYLGRLAAERAAAEEAERQRIADAVAQHAAAIEIAARTNPSRPRTVIREVAAKHNLAADDLMGRSRLGHIVLARQEVMWRLRADFGLSSTDIGIRLGGRDHTTVLWGIRQHQRRVNAATAAQSFGSIA